MLSADASGSALLRVVALAGLGRHQVQGLMKRAAPGLVNLAARPERPLHVEFVQIRHAPQERGATSPARRHAGWTLGPGRRFSALAKRAFYYADSEARAGSPELGRSNVGRLVLGYRAPIQPHRGTDSFDIHPDQRLRRCLAVFGEPLPLTDPLGFLRRLWHKSRYRAGRARALLERLTTDLSAWLGWDLAGILDPETQLKARWERTPASRRHPAVVALDIARHAFDAATHLDHPDPLQQPGVVLLEAPDRWCAPGRQRPFFELLDRWFPNLQFFVTLSASGRRCFPRRLLGQRLPIPQPQPPSPPIPVRRLPRGSVLLVDVDGTLPNLALMKLSRHFKQQARKVTLARCGREMPLAETVLASAVFAMAPSIRKAERLRQRYGAGLQVGGSGVDLRSRLAPEIEELAPDYSLYPQLGDRALGFLTRGCPHHCPFCLVPLKEGPPRQVSDLDTLLQGRQKLILLDDNLLAHPAALELLEAMARRNLAVNFNQTLDLRQLTPESARLLRRIRCSNVAFTRPNYYFSLNDTRHLELIRERYALLQTARRDNVEFVCMYGFNSSLAEDVARFRFLRSLPGAYVFMQRYRPVPGGPAPDLTRLFDERADDLLDELVRIVFRQNMKSMETYYRWLARQYASQRRRIHWRLVETLFRYNGRSRMGGFLLELEELSHGSGRAGLVQPAGPVTLERDERY